MCTTCSPRDAVEYVADGVVELPRFKEKGGYEPQSRRNGNGGVLSAAFVSHHFLSRRERIMGTAHVTMSLFLRLLVPEYEILSMGRGNKQ